jgi:hypothetical protein
VLLPPLETGSGSGDQFESRICGRSRSGTLQVQDQTDEEAKTAAEPSTATMEKAENSKIFGKPQEGIRPEDPAVGRIEVSAVRGEMGVFVLPGPHCVLDLQVACLLLGKVLDCPQM